ncbi:hypothetical protein BH24DEI1_BH24DEI1_02690 [soil metagenome]
MQSWWPSRIRISESWLRELRGPGDLLLLVHIFLFAAAVPLLLRLKLPTLLALLEGRAPAPDTLDPDGADKIVRYVDAVIRRGRPLVRRGCLTRGLTLFYFLRRAGLEVALAFGMGKPEGEVEGHCWLVREGEPFLEGRDPRPTFAEYYSFPPRAAP